MAGMISLCRYNRLDAGVQSGTSTAAGFNNNTQQLLSVGGSNGTKGQQSESTSANHCLVITYNCLVITCIISSVGCNDCNRFFIL